METRHNLNLALAVATEYRALVALGRYPEADQAASTIDELVGTWRWREGQGYVLTLPASVRKEMSR